jgi:hypothetical protein
MADRSPEGINEALVLLEQELSVANEKYTPSPGAKPGSAPLPFASGPSTFGRVWCL